MIDPFDRIKIVRDSRDKFIEGASNAILSQVGFDKLDPQNDYGADSLLNLAELALKRNRNKSQQKYRWQNGDCFKIVYHI